MSDSDLVARVFYSIAIITLLIMGLYAGRRYGKVPYLKYSLIWAALILLIAVAYSLKGSVESFGNVVLQTINPSAPVETHGTITITASIDSHFYIDVSINNKNIKFMIDTGATHNMLSIDEAKRLGIDVDNLVFDHSAMTAGGEIKMAKTKMELKILKYTYEDQVVMINPRPGIALLGLDFLKNFHSFNIKGDKLSLEIKY